MSGDVLAKCREAIKTRDEAAQAATTMLRLQRERLAFNRALTVVLDGIEEVLVEDHPLPERRGGPCDSCNYLAPCPDRRRATASLAAIAQALGVDR